MTANLSHAQMKSLHPEFFRPAKGEPRPMPSLGGLENAQIVRRPKQEVQKPQKSRVIKPGTVL